MKRPVTSEFVTLACFCYIDIGCVFIRLLQVRVSEFKYPGSVAKT